MEHSRSFPAPETAEDGVVAAGAYHNGRRVADIAIEDAAAWAAKEGHVVWIGLLEPSRPLLLRIKNEFHLHDLAIEDAEHAHQRPKIEQYGDALFIVARTAQLIDRRVIFGETHLFLAEATSSASGMDPRPPMRRSGSIGRVARRRWPRGRTSFSMRSSTSS